MDKTSATHVETVAAIWQKYSRAYDGHTQGCCPLIADEIQKAVGGEVVAGELTWNGGSCRRTHWWVERDGEVIDPMGDELLRHEEYPGPRVAHHRDAGIFRRVLPQFEQWRVA